MKNTRIILMLLIIGMAITSCNDRFDDDLKNDDTFENLVVPPDFNWSAINRLSLDVNIMLNDSATELYNATPLDLMDMNGNLLDKVTIYESKAHFDFRVPSSTEYLRLFSPLANQSMDVKVDAGTVTFNLMVNPEKSGLADYDGDGIADIFDDYPDNPDKAYHISYPAEPNKAYLNASFKDMNDYDPNFIDFEEGNRNYYRGYCWQFYSTTVVGSWGANNSGSSVRTGQLSNMPSQQPPHRLFSGWYEFDGSHTLEFVHKLNRLNGGGKYMDVLLVDTEGNTSQTLLEYEYSNSDEINETISINASGIFRLEWHWYGQGGNSRAHIDNISIDAVDATDYSSNNGVGVCDPAGSGGELEPGNPNYGYPGGDRYVFQIFEDLWPSTGDYDLNDLVLKNKAGWDRHSDNSISHIYVKTIVQAVGAGIHSGLGWEVFKNTGGSNREYMDNVCEFFGDVEADPNVNNGVICFDDVKEWQYTPYSNTGGLGPDAKPDTIEFQVAVPKGVMPNIFEMLTYIFRTDNPSHQVRTYGAPPTATADMSLFGTVDDDSPTTWDLGPGDSFSYPLTNEAAFYRTATNHTWAVEFISDEFIVAKETTDILYAYPQFRDWAESGGTTNQDWYKYPDNNYTYTPSY